MTRAQLEAQREYTIETLTSANLVPALYRNLNDETVLRLCHLAVKEIFAREAREASGDIAEVFNACVSKVKGTSAFLCHTFTRWSGHSPMTDKVKAIMERNKLDGECRMLDAPTVVAACVVKNIRHVRGGDADSVTMNMRRLGLGKLLGIAIDV